MRGPTEALMRHIREVDSDRHTVVMMQVENEVGVLRDSRDRSAAATEAFAGPVPGELMDYLQRHKDTLSPSCGRCGLRRASRRRDLGKRYSARVAGERRHAIQTTSPPMSPEEHEVSWRKLHWATDEIFMAWNYARFVNKVVAEARPSTVSRCM